MNGAGKMLWTGIFCIMMLLSACQETTSTPLAGKGRVVLSSEAAGVVIALDKDIGQLRFQRFLAVDAETRSWGATFCGVNAPGECIAQTDGPLGSDAVASCADNGGKNCRVLYSRGEIIWDGPVLRMARESTEVLPYHGSWPIEIRWPGKTSGSGRLIGNHGQFTLEGLRPLSDCTLQFGTTSLQKPGIRVDCADGDQAWGALRQAAMGLETVNGQTSGNQPMQIRIETSDGLVLPLSYRRRGSG